MDQSLYPDPLLTANIYCLDRLDDVIRRAVAPFWNELKARNPGGSSYLWLLRYSKSGDHLKVRLHGPESRREELREGLEDSADSFLRSLGPAEEGPPPVRWKNVPPVDAEDEAEESYPDRTLLWTHYRRSDVSLGRKPLLLDDRYTALFTTCLAQATELVLAAFSSEVGDKIPHNLRQTTLLNAIIAALGALGFSPDRRREYLTYHRDWLLRFALLKNGVPSAAAAEVLERFERRLPTMEKTLDFLRRTAGEQWDRGGREDEASHAAASWRHSLRDLYLHVQNLCTSPEYHVDPFAGDPTFTPLFKVLHGLGNQLGLLMLDEALGYHILLVATSPEAAGRNSLQLVAG